MSPEERAQQEAQADRCRRRGEIAQALAIYQALAAEFPGDEALASKIQLVSGSLQPLELQHPKANLSAEPKAATLEQQAEALANAGDVTGAVALYRRALAEKPDNELLRERLGQLFAQLKGAAASPPSSPSSPPSPPAGASSAATGASSGGREDLLRALLSQIGDRRRAG